jgi:hypothetical protein
MIGQKEGISYVSKGSALFSSSNNRPVLEQASRLVALIGKMKIPEASPEGKE